MSKPPQVGEIFEGYRIEGVLDEGGMGVVFRAEEVYSEAPVAIKCLHPKHAKRDDFTKRFRQESKFSTKLDHPNIVKVRRAGISAGGVPYLVMDLVEGKTLRSLLNKYHRLDALNAIYLMLQVADAMRYAHSRKIIHRDLKPENIMVGTKRGEKQGHVWVMDFGIAKMAEGGMDTDELPGLGTVRYMSPEQARAILRPAKSGRRIRPDHRVDIFAFGVTFYEAVTGKHTSIDDEKPARSFDETLEGILEAEPAPPHELVDDCSLAMWDVISRCIALDPDARYASFDPIVEELRSLGREVLSRQHLSKEHRLSRHMAEEEARSARQAAFEAVVKESPSEEVVGASEVRAAANAPAAAQRTAPLAGFVPRGNALPFQIKGPDERALVDRGRGFTEELPKPAALGSAAGASPAGQATLPIGRGRGHTMKIPKGALPPPSPLPEAMGGMAVLPVHAVTETPSAKTKTLETPEKRPAMVAMMSLMAFVTVLSVTAIVVSVSVWRQGTRDAPVSTISAPSVPAVAPVTSIDSSAAASPLSTPAPALSAAPVGTASAGVSSVRVPPPLPVEPAPRRGIAGAEPSPAITAEPPKAAKPKRAPVAAQPGKSSAPAFMLDFDDKPAPASKGRR